MEKFLTEAQDAANKIFDSIAPEAKEATPQESSPEIEQKDNPSQEGEKNTPDETTEPFHKHPRWRQMQKQLEEERSAREALKQEIESIKKANERADKTDFTAPDWFTEAFGDNPALWTKYQAYESSKEEQIRQKITKEEAEALEREQQEAERNLALVDAELEKLEVAHDVTFDDDKRTEFLGFMNEYMPTDKAGNVDFNKGYELFSKLHKPVEIKDNTEAKKQIAALSSGDSGKSTDAKRVLPKTEDLRSMSVQEYLKKFVS